MLRRSLLHATGHVDGDDRVKPLYRNIQVSGDALGQCLVFVTAAAQIDRLDPLAAQLVLRGGNRATNLAHQGAGLLRRAILAGQTHGARQHHVVVDQHSQIGLARKQINQHANPLGRLATTSPQQRSRGEGPQHQPARLEMGLLARLLNLLNQLRRNRGGQHLLPFVALAG